MENAKERDGYICKVSTKRWWGWGRDERGGKSSKQLRRNGDDPHLRAGSPIDCKKQRWWLNVLLAVAESRRLAVVWLCPLACWYFGHVSSRRKRYHECTDTGTMDWTRGSCENFIFKILCNLFQYLPQQPRGGRRTKNQQANGTSTSEIYCNGKKKWLNLWQAAPDKTDWLSYEPPDSCRTLSIKKLVFCGSHVRFTSCFGNLEQIHGVSSQPNCSWCSLAVSAMLNLWSQIVQILHFPVSTHRTFFVSYFWSIYPSSTTHILHKPSYS